MADIATSRRSFISTVMTIIPGVLIASPRELRAAKQRSKELVTRLEMEILESSRPKRESSISYYAAHRDFFVSSFSSFDTQSGEWINEMFEKRRIDGAIRNGKQTGAWCAPWLSGKSAWILCSFNEKLGDVYTLAHENGHALHDYLMSRAQTPVNSRPSSCTAEGGSIFGELIVRISF